MTHDLRLSNAWVEVPFDRSIHCYFQSSNGIVPCIIKDDAVVFMAGSQPYEVGWRIITGSWSDQLTAIAADKLLRNPEGFVVISAGDLEGHHTSLAMMPE
ncbi:MAG TPA: hypothetical protein VND94_18750 [Terriglobia bacterium]|nr:hypothetical protein [Terriglobia bacterium]